MGEKIRGDFIETHNVILKGNKMIFDFEKEYGGKGLDTLILKYQYFSTMKVMDPKTRRLVNTR